VERAEKAEAPLACIPIDVLKRQDKDKWMS